MPPAASHTGFDLPVGGPATPTMVPFLMGLSSPDQFRWITFSLTVPQTGEYTLNLGASSGINNGDMFVLFDNFRQIPSPGTSPLLALSCMVLARRRR